MVNLAVKRPQAVRNNSQPKLELYGCFKALQYWRLYLVGVKRLILEMDAKFIKDMLNNTNLQLNATMNQ